MEFGSHGRATVGEGTVMVADIDYEVETGSFVAFCFYVWHFCNAAVEV